MNDYKELIEVLRAVEHGFCHEAADAIASLVAERDAQFCCGGDANCGGGGCECHTLRSDLARAQEELDSNRKLLDYIVKERDKYYEACIDYRAQQDRAQEEIEGMRRDAERAKAMTAATFSHVDGRDLLHELSPNGAHHIDICVRINGQDRWHEGDWLKRLTWARDGHNKAEHAAIHDAIAGARP